MAINVTLYGAHASSLKSSLVPTRIIGIPGEYFFNSLLHKSTAFLNVSGFAILKHSIKISVSG